MADFDLPDDLLAAQRAYDEADARVQQIADALPSSVAVVALEAEISDEQRRELAEARAERLRWVEVLAGHPWWATLEPERRAAARTYLRRTARA